MKLDHYLDVIHESYQNYATYLWKEITLHADNAPHWDNYFYWLTGLSAFFFLLEIIRPWRKEQPRFRKDFWLDLFYVYFNYFLFSLIVFNAAGNVAVELFNDFLGLFNVKNLVMVEVKSWPIWLYFLVMFVVADFLQWNIHRLLHRVPFLWEFHKVHHSVEQMGFAAHLRYHWMENVVYKSLQYIPLTMIGYGVEDLFILYMFQTAVGHWNHANFELDIGPLKYILNNPRMHIWHHAKELPDSHPYGINFGLTLSCWDYIFGTAHIPHDGRDIELGFPDDEDFPQGFFGQLIYGIFGKRTGSGTNAGHQQDNSAQSGEKPPPGP